MAARVVCALWWSSGPSRLWRAPGEPGPRTTRDSGFSDEAEVSGAVLGRPRDLARVRIPRAHPGG
ncbi:hypothetical protein [Streptomyces chrestomyceticus]|uniref:hypothetical protein n=1 Tax=Streptomyces chrestomyceticus TaxID=68185 RepID=UPI0035A89B6C